ncbi:hypothetical protein SAMN05519103_09658 [Rhizobiales bacterium GAS113]|nr:hypothetical protein SAMN05519103_09658 [Rhizobiales bacterium GAS113]
MAHLQIKQTRKEGRTFIRIECTPKSPETRTLLREFKAGVKELEKKWKASVRAREKLKE